MPGDRIVVYRDPIVRFTVFLDRLAAPFQTVIGSMLQTAFTIRAVKFAAPTARAAVEPAVQPEPQSWADHQLTARAWGQVIRCWSSRCRHLLRRSPEKHDRTRPRPVRSRIDREETGRIAFRPSIAAARVEPRWTPSPIYG